MADYVGSINGPPRWSLERFLLNCRPFSEPVVPVHGSIEYKLMYQFHALIPENWTPSAPGSSVEELLTKAMATPAGRMGARHIPAFMKPAEVKAINWGRQMGTCTLNDFREAFKFPRLRSFEELNSDPDVQKTLAELYPGGIDDVELYVGVICEEYKRGYGTAQGLSIPDTLFFAIRKDALSAGLGDRFYTQGWTPEYLTPWGYEHALRSGRLTVLVRRHTTLNIPVEADLFHVGAVDLAGTLRAPTQENMPQE